MKESEIKYFFVRMLFRGNPKWFEFRVPHDDWKHLRKVLCETTGIGPRQIGYMHLTTSERRYLTFRLADVQAAHFQWDPIKSAILPEKDDDEADPDDIRVYVETQTEPITFVSLESPDIFHFVEDIECPSAGDNPYVSIIDVEGEEFVFNAEHVYLVDVNARVINETFPVSPKDGSREDEDEGEEERGEEYF